MQNGMNGFSGNQVKTAAPSRTIIARTLESLICS